MISELERQLNRTVRGRAELSSLRDRVNDAVRDAIADGHEPGLYLTTILRWDLIEEIARKLGIRD
jgi:hypothetical protein